MLFQRIYAPRNITRVMAVVMFSQRLLHICEHGIYTAYIYDKTFKHYFTKSKKKWTNLMLFLRTFKQLWHLKVVLVFFMSWFPSPSNWP